jgi:hypothetical protein
VTSQELLDKIQKLPAEERQHLLDLLGKLPPKSSRESRDNGDAVSSRFAGGLEADILNSMLAEGLISHIPEGITDEEDDFEPIDVTGQPLSETIIEERR